MKIYISINTKGALAPGQELILASGKHWLKLALAGRTFTLHWGRGRARAKTPDQLADIIAGKTGLDNEAILLLLFGEQNVSPRTRQTEIQSSDKSDDGMDAGASPSPSPHGGDKEGGSPAAAAPKQQELTMGLGGEQPSASCGASSASLSANGVWEAEGGQKGAQQGGEANARHGKNINMDDMGAGGSRSPDLDTLIREVKEALPAVISGHMGGSSQASLTATFKFPVVVELPQETGKLNYMKYSVKKRWGLPLNWLDYNKPKMEEPFIFYIDDSPSMRYYIPIVEGLSDLIRQLGRDVKLLRGPNGRINKIDGERVDKYSLSLHQYLNEMSSAKIYIFADDDPHWTVKNIKSSVVWYHIGKDLYDTEIPGVEYRYITTPSQLFYIII